MYSVNKLNASRWLFQFTRNRQNDTKCSFGSDQTIHEADLRQILGYIHLSLPPVSTSPSATSWFRRARQNGRVERMTRAQNVSKSHYCQSFNEPIRAMPRVSLGWLGTTSPAFSLHIQTNKLHPIVIGSFRDGHESVLLSPFLLPPIHCKTKT